MSGCSNHSFTIYPIKTNFRRNHYGNEFGLGFAQSKLVAIVISALCLLYLPLIIEKIDSAIKM